MPLSLGIALEISAIPFTEEIPKEKPFTCNLCERQFSLMGVLKAHFQRTHPNQPFKTSYSVSNNYAQNNTIVSSPKPNESNSRKTTSNLFAKNDSSHKCDVCQKDFPKRIDLIKHKFVHRRFNVTNLNCVVAKANILHKCDTCKKEFSKMHPFKMHANVKCELCSNMHCHTWLYTKKMCLDDDECVYCKRELCERCHNLHQTEKKTYVKTPEVPQECVLCKEIFQSKRSLKDHYVAFHKLKNVLY